jgi:hypothetical protein
MDFRRDVSPIRCMLNTCPAACISPFARRGDDQQSTDLVYVSDEVMMVRSKPERAIEIKKVVFPHRKKLLSQKISRF